MRMHPFIVSTLLLYFLDFLYVSLISNSFQLMIIRIQRVVLEVRIFALILCYIGLTLGLNYFIIQPKKSVTDAFILGIFVYFIYNMTNYTTLKKWSPVFAVRDTLWGGCLFALVTYGTKQLV